MKAVCMRCGDVAVGQFVIDIDLASWRYCAACEGRVKLALTAALQGDQPLSDYFLSIGAKEKRSVRMKELKPTRKEHQIMTLLVKYRGDRQKISDEIGISRRTVDYHIGNVIGKTGTGDIFSSLIDLQYLVPGPKCGAKPPEMVA